MSILQQIIAKKIAGHVGDEKFYGLYMDTADEILVLLLDETANTAMKWLEDWAYDLYETQDAYIEAQTTGKMNNRSISKEAAKQYAKEFRERAEAVADCARPVAKAILEMRKK